MCSGTHLRDDESIYKIKVFYTNRNIHLWISTVGNQTYFANEPTTRKGMGEKMAAFPGLAVPGLLAGGADCYQQIIDTPLCEAIKKKILPFAGVIGVCFDWMQTSELCQPLGKLYGLFEPMKEQWVYITIEYELWVEVNH